MANNWAIAIGINHYDHLMPARHLQFAVRDAEYMRSFLCGQAGFAPDNVLLCTDDSPAIGSISTRPSLTNLQRLLLEHMHRAENADNFWFFFAGHGMVGRDRQDYLLPCDGYPNYLEGSAIPIQFVAACLRQCSAKNIVLILDMCRHEGAESSRDIGTDFGSQTIEITRQQGIVTLFSCGRGEYSYEIPELGQGAFTHTLLTGLQQHTILRDLEQYLAQQVPLTNRQYGQPDQVPLVICEPANRYDLSLLPEYATETDVASLISLAKDAELDRQYAQAKNLWWQVIQSAKSSRQIVEARRGIERIEQHQSAQLTPQPSPPSANRKRLLQVAGVSVASLGAMFIGFLAWNADPWWPTPQPNHSSGFEDRPLSESQTTFSPTPADLEAWQDTYNDERLEQIRSASFATLERLLEEKSWKAADEETLLLIMQAINPDELTYFDSAEIITLPCEALGRLNQLWVQYSNGRFGFTVQKQAYLEAGGKIHGNYSYSENDVWYDFGDAVEWRTRPSETDGSLTFTANAPMGHLPVGSVQGPTGGLSGFGFRYLGCARAEYCFAALMARLESCEIAS